VNIEQLGGLGKKMPYTAAFFLIGAIAICGLPPLNGFISEFIIFSGLIRAIHLFGLSESFSFVIVIAALALIGGLAILCFTKAFGIVFQGSPRQSLPKEPVEGGWVKKAPMILISIIIVFIGFFPALIMKVMERPLGMMVPAVDLSSVLSGFTKTLTGISIVSGIFIVIIGLILWLRKLAQRKVTITTSETWGCGYVAPNPRMQYTANSFARTFRKLFEPLVLIKKEKINITQVFPQQAYTYESHSRDRIEDRLITVPLEKLIHFMGRFRIFQNGQTQSYLMYAFLFIIIILIIEFFRL
jgi:NADH:ubiquinone oxidoreductase subunit 5 (subunit L)/multisubunit Na+/H+ antiporter MnhA subunit